MAAGRLKHENFSGDPRSGAEQEDLLVLVRREHDDRVVSEGLSRSGKQLRRFVMRGLELRSSMNLG